MPVESRFDFRGGVSGLTRQLANQAKLIENLKPTADGTLEVRPGYLQVLEIATTGYIQQLLTRYDNIRGLRIYSVRLSDGVNDLVYENTGLVDGATDLGTNDYVSIDVYKDTVFVSNGISPINYIVPGDIPAKQWAEETWGTSPWGERATRAEVTGSPTPPKGKHMLFYKNKCFVGTVDGKVYWSNGGMFTTLPTTDFPTANAHTIGSSGDPVTGMIAGQDVLLACTEGSYNLMTGLPGDNADINTMSWQQFKTIGTLSPRSLSVDGENFSLFGRNRYMYELRGTVPVDLDPNGYVYDYLQAVPTNLLPYVTCKYIGNELWVYLPSEHKAASGRTLIYNKNLESWSVHTNLDTYCMVEVSNFGTMYFSSVTGSQINEIEAANTDNGTDIDFEFIGKQEAISSFRARKRFESLSVHTKTEASTSITAYYQVDDLVGKTRSWGSELWGAAPWEGGPYVMAGANSSISTSGDEGAAENWGDSNWGQEPWGGKVSKTTIVKFEDGKAVEARLVRVRLKGTGKSGDGFLGYDIEGNPVARETGR